MIPDQSGVIHGCYSNDSGALRVTDSDDGAPPACNDRETALTWRQTGPAGPQGPAGPAGSTGAEGPKGAKGRAGTLVLKGKGPIIKPLSAQTLLKSVLKKLKAMDDKLSDVKTTVHFNKGYLKAHHGVAATCKQLESHEFSNDLEHDYILYGGPSGLAPLGLGC